MKALTLALHYFPFVLQAVIAIQREIAAAPGADKKSLAMSSAIAAAKVGETVDEQHIQVISALIDSTVSTLKGIGVFAKDKAPAVPAVALAQ